MFKTTIASIAVLLAFTPAIAEETGFEVEETTQQEQSVMKYIFANTGGKYLKGSIGSRYIYGATAGIDYPFSNGKLYLKTNISKQELRMEVKQKSWAKIVFPGEADKKDIVINKTYTTVEEAFVEKSFGNASLSLGRSKIVFSDGVGITPFSYLTPNKSLSSGFEGAKLDSLIAQDNIQLAYNVFDNFEVRGYYIVGANVDPFERKAKETAVQQIFNPNTKLYDDRDVEIDDKVNGSGAITLSYYPSWGKVMVLYSDGYDMNAFQNQSIVKDESNGTHTIYNIRSTYRLAKAKAYGFLADWKLNSKIDLGVEAIRVETKDSVYVSPYGEKTPSNTDTEGKKILEEETAGKDYLIEENGGSNLFPIKYNLVAFKAGYKTGRWTLSGNIMTLKIQRSSMAKEYRKKEFGASEDPDWQFLFGGVVNYDIDAEGRKSISGFGGVMPLIAGAGIGYNQQVTDNFSFSVNGMGGKFIKDETLAEAYGKDKYKQDDSMELFVGMSVNYKL